MSETKTDQQVADILRVLQGDKLAKTPGLVAEVNRSTVRVRRLSRDVTKLTETVADQEARIVKLEDESRANAVAMTELKTRQRLMWKIITGGLTGATAIAGTVGGVVAALTP